MSYREGMKNGKSSKKIKQTKKLEDKEEDEHEKNAPKAAKSHKKEGSLKKEKYVADGMAHEEEDEDEDEGFATIKASEDHIDYSKTLESAYGNLENILGKDGIKDISKTTQDLMNQQKMLMINMKEMEPMMNMAGDFITKIGGNGLGDLLGGILSKKK